MKAKKLLFLLGVTATLLTTSVMADDANARAIMEKVDARDDGTTLEQDMLMVLIDKNGNERTRDLKSYGKDFGADEHRTLFFKSPADVKKHGILNL
jgi:hypothetical protein